MRAVFFAALAPLALACSDDVAPPGSGGAGGVPSTATGGAGGSSTSSSTGGIQLPATFTISGVVRDQEGAPVEGAYVLQGGRSHEPTEITVADGSYRLTMHYAGLGIPTVVAGKIGYRAAGVEIFHEPDGPVDITVHAVEPPDNEAYVYGEPGHGGDPTTAYCGHCHETFAAEFQTSKHARAADNPLVQHLYAGVSAAYADQASCQAAGGRWLIGQVPGTVSDVAAKCYLGGGVLPDLNGSCGGPAEAACDDPTLAPPNAPTAFGACADCHAPGIDGPAGGRDLHDAVGVAFDNGVHCDACHKTRDVDLNAPAGVAGRLVRQRPSETIDGTPSGQLRQVMFGPLLDVPNAFMGGSYQPKFSQAEFCAGCHLYQQAALIPGDALDPERWPDGLPVHSTYDEWLAGPYSQAGVPCQHCHMPVHLDLFSTTEVAAPDNTSITFGFGRPPEQIRAHVFRGPLTGSPRLLDSALNPHLTLSANASTLEVEVTLANVGCGHALPTGEPMRALILLVEASCDGTPLAAVGGMTVPDTGGARARGVIGTDVQAAGAQLTWSAAALAGPGDVVRVVRPTGSFDDYAGIGFFANPTLTPADKGMPIFSPVGSAEVVSATSGVLTLDRALGVQSGDIVYLGDALVAFTDGGASLGVAGAPGYSFSRVMVDASGRRHVPHYRAVDIASDNRIPPAGIATTTHSFAHPGTCTAATVTATVLYRPIPLSIAAERGVPAKDYIAIAESKSLSL